ncbi:MAG: DUF433 domain-containing protein [Saprospiraceae bacterium]
METNPKIMVGKPVIRGTRITVEQILEDLATGDTIEDLLAAYPRLKKEHILAALEYAAQIMKKRVDRTGCRMKFAVDEDVDARIVSLKITWRIYLATSL